MNSESKQYDVLVVGAGHAGCEAALAAARMGAVTGLVTIERQAVARMSCNPAIGGIAKSHIVCELDALGGEIGRNTDYSGIQFRTLNTKKGPAVQANRVQCDKHVYSERMLSIVQCTPLLEIIEGVVTDLLMESGKLDGVILRDGSRIKGHRVVVAPGTFLRGTIHVGKKSFPGGRKGEENGAELSLALKEIGHTIERFKTGTPPRLHRRSINTEAMQVQPGVDPAPLLSRAAAIDRRLFHVEQRAPGIQELKAMFHVEQFMPEMRPWPPGTNQTCCYLTHTTEETHDIIRSNLSESALYGGPITATGVRYCPSLEDKIVKFPDRHQHHVFIEPEGRSDVTIYPNGISNSLPEQVQEEFVRSIPGLEQAEFLDWGYGIEHDYADPRQLTHSLESKLLPGLFLAGQINGTTGYEEAAAQGFVAGVNAVRSVRGEPPFMLGRNEAYIGVLIDDLVVKGTDEPYRMFTSRAEHRLLLRQDNAPYRMLEHARQVGILSNEALREVENELDRIEAEISRLEKTHTSEGPLAHLLRRPGVNYEMLPGDKPPLGPQEREQVEIRVKYAGYIQRELNQVRQMAGLEKEAIPPSTDFHAIKALRFEARQKLSVIQPRNLGQAARIPGVNPADISLLSVWLKRARSEKPA